MRTTSDLDSLAARLSSPAGAQKFAERWLASILECPVGELVQPEAVARTLHELLAGLANGAGTEAHLLARAEALCARFEAEALPLGRALPAPVPEAALRLARRQHQPHRQVVLRVIDREPVRQLIRVLLVEALVEFGKKLAAPISGSRVGKGLGALGSIAGAVGSSVFGAVGVDVEKQLERRAAEFADGALSKVLNRVVDLASDPRRGAEQAELRAAIAEGALEVPVRDWVAELRKADPKSLVAEVRGSLRAFVERPEALAELEREARFWLEPVAVQPLAAVLDELGVRAAVERAALEQLAARAQQLDWAALFAAL